MAGLLTGLAERGPKVAVGPKTGMRPTPYRSETSRDRRGPDIRDFGDLLGKGRV
jgi:hypothetical protein